MSGYFFRNTNFEIKKIEKSDCQGQTCVLTPKLIKPKNIIMLLEKLLRGHSNNTCHFFKAILDPMCHFTSVTSRNPKRTQFTIFT